MKKVNKIENITKDYNNIFIRKKLLSGLLSIVIATVSLSGCSKKEKETIFVPSFSVENAVVNNESEVFINKYGSEMRRPLNNKIYEDEEWAYVKLYDRDVRDYSDGSVGYSEWRFLGEFLVKNLGYLDKQREYRYDYISSINICDVIKEKVGVSSISVSYFGDSIISLDDVKLYDYLSRDYLDGQYTDWKSDGIIYISDQEYKSSDVISFKEIDIHQNDNTLSLMLNNKKTI